MKHLRIGVLPGDGIGREVMESALEVFQYLDISHEFLVGEIGFECWKKEGNTVPQATWDIIDQVDTVLLGAVTSKPLAEAEMELTDQLKGKGHKFVSPVIQLRQKLGLFANVRPVFDVVSKNPRFNFCVIRENTEGLYAGLDFAEIPPSLKDLMIKERTKLLNWEAEDLDHASCAIRLQTQKGLERLFIFAFEYAKKNSFTKITLADKPNVLRYSGHFAKTILERIATNYSDISFDIQNVDAVALQLVRKPEQYQVIVAENMFGDILSDLGAGIMGGLGFAPSANIGNQKSYFEPVHGSAPKHANLNKANPSAMFLTIALMLKHHGFEKEGLKIERAVKKTIHEAEHLSYDLGGNASTKNMAKAIIENLSNDTIQLKTVSIISTGSELLSGDFVETNSGHISKALYENSIATKSHATVSDHKSTIVAAIKNGLIESEAVIITGGLGPTSDDNTREAVSMATGIDLEFNENTWEKIKARLSRFNIYPNDSNRKQAMFPKACTIIPNKNGTAAGCILQLNHSDIIFLPGPPRECLPMFSAVVLPYLKNKGYQNNFTVLKWKLIGVIESDIAPKLDKIFEGLDVQTSYCLNYPYLDFKICFLKSMTNQINLQRINKIIRAYAVSFNKEGTASEQLLDVLQKQNIGLVITDHATKGGLSQKLSTKNEGNTKCEVIVDGLDELWDHQSFSGTTAIRVSVDYKNKSQDFSISIPYRGIEVKDYAVEYASFAILKTVDEHE